MKFQVGRTSVWSGKPCEEAYQDEFTRIDVRTFGSFEEYDERFRDNWTDKGENHCINERGRIQREFKEMDWFIDIKSLEELIDFKNKYERIVIEESWDNPNITRIEIYDTWRE